MFKRFIAWFTKDVDALLTDFSKLGAKLEARAAHWAAQAVSYEQARVTAFENAAKASKVAQNIKSLIGEV